MAKKKSTQTQQQTQSQNNNFANTASYGEYTPSDTADIASFRSFRPQVDPGLAAQYGASRNRLNQSFINPLGAQYSPHIADALKRDANRQLDMDESQAFRQGAYDVNQQREGQLATLAGLTQPRLVQTGSSGTSSGTGTMQGTGTVTQGNNLFGDILSTTQAAASIASM